MVEKPKASPESLAELIGTLEDVTYPPRTIVLSYDDGEGVGYRGQVVTNLPAGVVDRLAPESTTMAPEVFRASTHKVEALPYYMLGKHAVRVQVKDANK
jgi:hypothetical protein